MKKTLSAVCALAIVFLFFGSAPAAPPKDTLVIAQGVDPGTLDPQDHYETPAFYVLLNIYETLLLRYDDMKLQPLLATSWKLVNDTTWEFELQRGSSFKTARTSTRPP